MTGSVLIVPIFLDNDTKNEFYFPLWIFFFCISGLPTMYICYIRKNAVCITFKREKKRKLGLISCPLSVISEDKQGGITLPGHMFLIMRRCGNSLPKCYRRAFDITG